MARPSDYRRAARSKADERSGNFLFSFVSIGFQWWITASLLTEFGKRDPDAGGSGSIIGVNILSGLGILLGLLLLVIPGLILWVRWSMAVPIVLSERDGASAALRESWYRTEGRFWPILGLLLVVYVPLFGLALAVGALLSATMPVAMSIVVNAGVSLALVVGWHAAIAMFFASNPPMQSLEEVFA